MTAVLEPIAEFLSGPDGQHDDATGQRTLTLHPVTVVIPTRNEVGNIGVLVDRLSAVADTVDMEVIFVDDSSDATPDAIRAASAGARPEITLVHRAEGEQVGGLGGAVAVGMARASAPWVCVMDADLQHPPELILELVKAASQHDVDLVVASRYSDTGDAKGLSALRSLVSKSTTTAAKVLFPRRLRNVSDPMSGFFIVRKAAVDLSLLRPRGFKILLELMVRNGGLRRSEVSFHFAERHSGTSKASLKEGLNYLQLLLALRLSSVLHRRGGGQGRRSRLGRFAAVGATGLLVNQFLLAGLVEVAAVNYLLASVLATQGSTIWNYVLTDRWVFPGKRKGSWWRRFLPFTAVNNAALFLRVPLLAVLTGSLHVHYLISNLVSLVALFACRYLLADKLIWKQQEGTTEAVASHADPEPSHVAEELPKHVRVTIDLTRQRDGATHGPSTPAKPPSFSYDLAGLVRISSEVRLPELAYFRVVSPVEDPDIEIRSQAIGRRLPNARISVLQAPDYVLYEEQLGCLGANFSIDTNDRIRVTAGPLLARSPHVLYTNVVEPLLRSVMVSKDHVLLHCGVVVLNGRGVMISAPADTGKTTTLLRLLADHGGRFLGDDMVIVDAQGRASCYPKPLTVSQTSLAVAGIDAQNLRRRRTLRVQGRLHSSSGRSAGQRLARHNLPIMACNAIVQKLVPPPKYMVDELLPCPVEATCTLDDLFFIENHGPNHLEPVELEEAVSLLLAHSDDAYGFPPFSYFAPALSVRGQGYWDLRLRERSILTSSMAAVRARRLVREDYSWAPVIAGLVEPMEGAGPVGGADGRPTLTVVGGNPRGPLPRLDEAPVKVADEGVESVG